MVWGLDEPGLQFSMLRYFLCEHSSHLQRSVLQEQDFTSIRHCFGKAAPLESQPYGSPALGVDTSSHLTLVQLLRFVALSFPLCFGPASKAVEPALGPVCHSGPCPHSCPAYREGGQARPGKEP